jgi:hypothetical protein
MHRNTAIPFSVAIVALTAAGCAFRLPYLAPEYREPIVAIDLALEADKTPADPSTAVKPHITLLQGYIKSSNVHAFTASVAMVMATTELDRLSVRPISGSGLAGAVDPSPALRALQERVTEIFSAYAVDPTDDTSLIVTADGQRPSSDAMHNVLYYVPRASGVNFRPHIMAGAGQSAPAAGFTPMGAAVYQLDRTGLATRTLWTWTGESGAR